MVEMLPCCENEGRWFGVEKYDNNGTLKGPFGCNFRSDSKKVDKVVTE